MLALIIAAALAAQDDRSAEQTPQPVPSPSADVPAAPAPPKLKTTPRETESASVDPRHAGNHSLSIAVLYGSGAFTVSGPGAALSGEVLRWSWASLVPEVGLLSMTGNPSGTPLRQLRAWFASLLRVWLALGPARLEAAAGPAVLLVASTAGTEKTFGAGVGFYGQAGVAVAITDQVDLFTRFMVQLSGGSSSAAGDNTIWALGAAVGAQLRFE